MLHRIKLFTVVALALLTSLPAWGQGLALTAEEKAWIASSRPIRVFMGNWPPFQIIEPTPHGICRDFLELVGKKTGLRFSFRKATTTWGATLEAFREDVPPMDILPSIRRTKAREQYLLITDPYVSVPWVIVTRQNFPKIETLDDLEGATVTMPKDFVIHELMERDYPDMRYLLTNNPEEGLKAVSSGAVDAFVGNLMVAAWLIDKNGLSNLRIGTSTRYGQFEQAMAVRRDMPQLQHILNKAFASITPEERAGILNRWGMLRVEHAMDYDQILHWLLMIGIPGAAFLLMACYSNRKLRHQIRERKEAEQHARKSQEVLQQVLDGLRAAVVTVEPKEQLIIDVNKEAELLIGLPREKLIGKSCRFLCGMKTEGEKPECPLLNENIHLGEFLIARPDGRKVPVMKTVVASRKDGRVVFLEVMFDISEKKEAERDQLQAQKLESIGRLAAGVAHEINTPSQFVSDNLRFLREELEPFMTMIGTIRGGLCDALKEHEKIPRETVQTFCNDAHMEYLLAEVPQALEETMEGIERITQIVQSMKSFAHPDEMQPVDVTVTEAIHNTLMVARNEWKHVCEIEVDLPPDLPAIKVIPGLFNQVVLNLLINAVDAIREKFADTGKLGLIRITGDTQGDMVELRLHDNADGIPESVRNNVFDPFFTTKPVGRGTGQGLAIAYSVIVEKYGGELFFESARGEGTTFVVRLPASA